eukprot:Hpha_TRINITY_DN3468_c0_g1::TRINITY_DN3468_c0_g1_i1::g.32529::m.32529
MAGKGSGGLTLFVNVDGGSTTAIELDTDATVADIYSSMQAQLPERRFEILFQDEVLGDKDVSLADRGICPQSTLQLRSSMLPTWFKHSPAISISEEGRKATRPSEESENCIAHTEEIKGRACFGLRTKNEAGLTGLLAHENTHERLHEHMYTVAARGNAWGLQIYTERVDFCVPTEARDAFDSSKTLPKGALNGDGSYLFVYTVDSEKGELLIEIVSDGEYIELLKWDRGFGNQAVSVAIGLYTHNSWAEICTAPPRQDPKKKCSAQ